MPQRYGRPKEKKKKSLSWLHLRNKKTFRIMQEDGCISTPWRQQSLDGVIFGREGCCQFRGMVVTEVSRCRCGQMMISNKRSYGQKCTFFFFYRNKAEQRDVGTTVTIDPGLPIILYAPLTYTDLAVGQEWRGRTSL